MSDLNYYLEQLRLLTEQLEQIAKTADTELLRQIAVEAKLKEIKAARRELTKPRVMK